MNKEQFKPFLEWADSKGIYKYCEECVASGNITGIWGYLLEFFDSVGIIVDIQPVMNYNSETYTSVNNFIINITKFNELNEAEIPHEETRPEAQQEAIKKAFEILENKK